MQRLEVSGAVRPIYGSLDVKRLMFQGLGAQEEKRSRHYVPTKHRRMITKRSSVTSHKNEILK